MEYQAYIFDGKSDPNHTTGWSFVDNWPISGAKRVLPQALTRHEKGKFHLAKIVTNAETYRPNNPYPDILCYNIDDDLYSQLVADIINEFEPNTHDIFQLIIVDEGTGKEIRRDYYYLYLTNFTHCIDEEHTVFSPATEHTPKKPSGGHKPQVTLFANAIEGKHLWRDSRFPNARFCSGAFKQRLDDEEIGGYRFYPCSVV